MIQTFRRAMLPIIVLMFIALAGLALTATCHAGTVYTEGYLKYTIKDGSITIIEYFGKDKTVTVPNQIAGVPVNTIAKGTFKDTPATKVKLPDTVTSIESGAIGSGVEVVYNSNTKDPVKVEPGDGAGSGDGSGDDSGSGNSDGSGSNGTTLQPGDKFSSGGNKYTVVKDGKLKDSKGASYTIGSNGQILNSEGDVVGQVPDEYLTGTGDEIAFDEADVDLEEEIMEEELSKGGQHGTAFAVIFGGAALLAAIALVVVLVRRKKRSE